MKSKQVFAHYFTWFATRERSGQWCHWDWPGKIPHNPDDFKNNRRDIASIRYPMLEPYDSGDEKVLRQHIDWALAVGIDFFTVDWYGPEEAAVSFRDRIVDKNLKTLMRMARGKSFGITVCYEEKLLFENANLNVSEKTRIAAGKKHLEWVRRYFDDPAYQVHNNRPVLIIWGSHRLKPESMAEVLNDIRRDNPLVLYSYFDESYIGVVDGFYPWVYISPQQEIRDRIVEDYRRMKTAFDQGTIELFSASVWPDFDDWGVQAWDLEPTRKCPEPEGLYEMVWDLALQSGSQMVSIATFNDWNEGSNIEPCRELGNRYMELTERFTKRFKAVGQ